MLDATVSNAIVVVMSIGKIIHQKRMKLTSYNTYSTQKTSIDRHILFGSYILFLTERGFL